MNPVFHTRTTSIQLNYCFIREKVSKGTLAICYVPSGNQLADIFSKSLSQTTLFALRTKVGLFFYNQAMVLRGYKGYPSPYTIQTVERKYNYPSIKTQAQQK